MRRLGLLWRNAWWKLVLLKILLYSSAASGQLTLASSVTAADANRLYGDPNPAFTGTITGIKNADNITATYASAATAASPVGTYAIVPTLVDPDHKLGNYVVTSNEVDEQQHVGELGPVPWATDVLTHFVSPRQPEAFRSLVTPTRVQAR